MTVVRGIKSSGGTDYVSGFLILADEANTDANAMVAGINNVTINDANVLSSANIDPSKVGDYSATITEARTTRNPLATTDWTETAESLATDLEGEVGGLRWVLEKMTGGPYWLSRGNQGVLVANTGDVKANVSPTPAAGWILLDDGTIGNAASGASNRANADTVTLYALLWATYSDTICPVSSGRGASAAADYAANKTLRLPLFAGRTLGVSGTPSSANLIDAYTGTQGHTGTVPVTGGSTTVWTGQHKHHSTPDDTYNGFEARMLTGANAGTNRTITDYDGGICLFTTAAFAAAVSAADTYAIYANTVNGFLLPFTSSPTVDDALNGYTLTITGGTGSGQTRTISDYVGVSRLALVSVNWVTTPDHTSTYSISKAIPTRANGSSIGRDLLLPSLSGMPAHQHPLHTDSTDGTNRDLMRVGNFGSSQAYGTNPMTEMGEGSSHTLYQPTVFMPWWMKL